MEANLARKVRARPRILKPAHHKSSISALLSTLKHFTPFSSTIPITYTWNLLKALPYGAPGTLRTGESHV